MKIKTQTKTDVSSVDSKRFFRFHVEALTEIAGEYEINDFLKELEEVVAKYTHRNQTDGKDPDQVELPLPKYLGADEDNDISKED